MNGADRAIGLNVTIRHHYDFGRDRVVVGADLVDPDAWDGLRTKTSGTFAIPATRAEFVRAAEGRTDLEPRARSIHAWLAKEGSASIASYGVGGAQLEFWLHVLEPDRSLIMTDYGRATVARLAASFPEAEVRYHDLRRDAPLEADIHLFHRIDTELTNNEWREVFARFADAPILMVATQILDLRGALVELSRRPLVRRRATRAGFVRTRAALESLWRSTHSARPLLAHDLHAWELRSLTDDRTFESEGRS